MSDTKKSVKGTKTEANLVISYLAESSAYTRYMFYAQQADKEGYFPVGEIFRATAENEMRHAKVYFKYLEGGSVTVPMAADAGVIGTTAENLAIAAKEEKFEGVELYEGFAKTAKEEGFDEIADHFSAIATIEQRHEDRFNHYLKQVQDGTVWKRDTPIKWQCLVCGYVYEGLTPPEVCPACDHRSGLRCNLINDYRNNTHILSSGRTASGASLFCPLPCASRHFPNAVWLLHYSRNLVRYPVRH